MTSQQVAETLTAAGCSGAFLTFILDREYACPAVDYITKEFAPWFWAEQYRRGVATWKAERNDCDNFAVRAFADMGTAHALAEKQTGKGLAFGLFFYTPDGSPVAHAINFAIIRGADGTHHVVWFEPQPQANTFGVVILTATERASCMGYLLC